MIVVRDPRRRGFIIAAAAVVVAFGLVYAVVTGRAFGVAVAILGGSVLAWMLTKGSDPTPYLMIDDDGLWCQDLGLTIAWADIRGTYRLGAQRRNNFGPYHIVLSMGPEAWQRYLDQVPANRRMVARANGMGRIGLTLALNGLNAPPDLIHKAIDEHVTPG